MRKLLLAPLRLSVGWGLTPRVLSILAAGMLVLLRLTIGWHFYAEGVEKYEQGDWTATPFFANARGPLQDRFRGMVWDYDGTIRLDRQRTLEAFAIYRDQAAEHYGFSEAQVAQAQGNFIRAAEQHEWILNQNASDLEEFEFGRERMKALQEDERERATRSGVDSLGGQRETIWREWLGKANPTLQQIDLLWRGYENAQNAVATSEQAAENGYLPLGKPSDAMMDTSRIDRIIPYFDIAIGLCLLLGLFTPVAALAAAGFLGSVFLSQYPPATGPTSSMYQMIECMGCLVLASTGAGRLAGLDYFLHLIVRKFAGPPDLAGEKVI